MRLRASESLQASVRVLLGCTVVCTTIMKVRRVPVARQVSNYRNYLHVLHTKGSLSSPSGCQGSRPLWVTASPTCRNTTHRMDSARLHHWLAAPSSWVGWCLTSPEQPSHASYLGKAYQDGQANIPWERQISTVLSSEKCTSRAVRLCCRRRRSQSPPESSLRAEKGDAPLVSVGKDHPWVSKADSYFPSTTQRVSE